MQEVQAILDRVMRLEHFYVEFEISEDFCFHGRFPFSLMINEQGFATARVAALTQDEAEVSVFNYFIQSSEYYFMDDDDDDDEDEDDEDEW